MLTTKFKLIPLHKKWELLEECCLLLNHEWKRSFDSRKQHLSKSCDTYPCHLLFVEADVDTENTSLVGHLRLSKVLGDDTSLLVTSVIISPIRRGCGLGRKLLELAEAFAASDNFQYLYLSSEDKGEFYKKCGYEKSHAVQELLQNNLKAKMSRLLQNMNQSPAEMRAISGKIQTKESSPCTEPNLVKSSTSRTIPNPVPEPPPLSSAVPAPPPLPSPNGPVPVPPPPLKSTFVKTLQRSSFSKKWMRKKLEKISL